MFTKIEVRDVACIRHVEIELTPVHAFIGPNDSGKSTVLRCIEALSQAPVGDPGFLLEQSPGASIRAWTAEGVSSAVLARPAKVQRDVRGDLGSAALVRFDAGALRKPSSLIPESDRIRFFSGRGQGLPGVYQAILSRGDDTFYRITEELRTLFPTVRHLRVPALSSDTLGIEVELVDGRRVRAEGLSDGILYYLGFTALQHITPMGCLLVEEPENGLHPSRIRVVISTLRRIAELHKTQILIATHSPLVVNEMKPEEVSVVTRPSLEVGTCVTPIRSTPNFDRRSSVYSLGELWLSYADGTTEAPLMSTQTDAP